MSGLLFVPSLEIAKPAATLHNDTDRPVISVYLGPVGSPWLEFRDAADIDALISELGAARVLLADAQGRNTAAVAAPDVPRPASPEPSSPDFAGTAEAGPGDYDVPQPEVSAKGPGDGTPGQAGSVGLGHTDELPALPQRGEPEPFICGPCQFRNCDDCHAQPGTGRVCDCTHAQITDETERAKP